ncbi:MAG: hypothetical protein FD152_3572, partial [Xanthobacteraceae bacterium]
MDPAEQFGPFTVGDSDLKRAEFEHDHSGADHQQQRRQEGAQAGNVKM